MLGDDGASAGGDQGGRCRDVPRASRVAPRTAGVDGVSRRGNGKHAGAHRPGTCRQNTWTLADRCKTDQKPADLREIGFAVHQRVKGRFQRLRRGELSTDKRRNGRSHRAHAALPA